MACIPNFKTWNSNYLIYVQLMLACLPCQLPGWLPLHIWCWNLPPDEPEILSSQKKIRDRQLLYRYWWNTRIFPLTKKSCLHCAQWRYYFNLSHVKISASSWLLRWLANKVNKRSWFLLGNVISIYKINRTLHDRLGYKFFLLVLIVSLTSEHSEQVRDTNCTSR